MIAFSLFAWSSICSFRLRIFETLREQTVICLGWQPAHARLMWAGFAARRIFRSVRKAQWGLVGSTM